MKLKHAAVLISVALLAACGSGKQEGEVRFLGTMPFTSGQKDTRSVQTFCPGCHDPIEVGKARCENKKCKTDMSWSGSGGVYGKDYRCPSCQGSGGCSACVVMEQTKGDCYNCQGIGVLIFQGQSPDCPNCKGTKKCPICKGKMICTDCGGAGKLAQDIVKSRSAKFVDHTGDLPDSDPREPVKKEEPKKDAAAPPTEEKK